VQNAFIESFNGTFREECLNQHWFVHLRDARTTIESYRVEYNTVRPHSALGYRSPEENQKLRSVAHGPGGASAFVHSQDWMKESNIKREEAFTPTSRTNIIPGSRLGRISLRYLVKWGDCPAGCINKHFWEFQVTFDGAVRFTGSGGDPLP
jgi:putative transposase